MSSFLVLAGGRGAELCEPLPVEGRHVVARVQQLIEPLHLRDPDRRLQVGEPIVEPDAVVLHLPVVRSAALVALAGNPLRDLLVGRDQDAALPRRHLLVRVEGEDRDVARRADLAALPVDGTEGLRRVLDHLQPILGGKIGERRQVDGVAEDVDGQDPRRGVANRGRRGVGIHVEGHRIDVAEDRLGSLVEEGVGRRDEAQRAGDDLVALVPALRPDAEVKRGRPARDRHRVVAAAEPLAEVVLELVQLWPQRERAGADDLQQQLLLARTEVRSCERDRFVHSACRSLRVAGRRTRASRPVPPRRPR